MGYLLDLGVQIREVPPLQCLFHVRNTWKYHSAPGDHAPATRPEQVEWEWLSGNDKKKKVPTWRARSEGQSRTRVARPLQLARLRCSMLRLTSCASFSPPQLCRVSDLQSHAMPSTRPIREHHIYCHAHDLTGCALHDVKPHGPNYSNVHEHTLHGSQSGQGNRVVR